MKRTTIATTLAALLVAGVVYANLSPIPETTFTTSSAQMSATAEAVGGAQTLQFLSDRFDVSTATLTQEKTQFGAEWGDLLLAYSFQRISRVPITIDQIFAMRAEGLGWAQISRYLRFGTLAGKSEVQTAVTTFTNQSGGTTSGTTTSGGTTTTSGGTTSGGTTGGTTTSGGGTTSGTTTGRTATSSRFPGAKGVDRKLTTYAIQFETSATSRGDQATAERLASEFGVTTDVLLQERTQFDAQWGDLYIAYLIVDRTGSNATLSDIFTLRDQGLSWTQIAHRYGIPPGRLLQAVRSGTSSLTTTTTTGDDETAAGGTHSTQISAKRSQGGSHSSGSTRMGGSDLTKRGGATKQGGASATRMGGASATKMGGASATKMGGASATKMGGASATKMGGASATRMGGASATRMGGASVTKMGGASATRIGAGATRVHGRGH